MRTDAAFAVDYIEIMSDLALELGGQMIPAPPEHLHYTVREPFGVVARIVPYNHPLFFSASKLAPPLVAGNAVILKAPHQAPLPAPSAAPDPGRRPWTGSERPCLIGSCRCTPRPRPRAARRQPVHSCAR
jgi:hypothetical protein